MNDSELLDILSTTHPVGLGGCKNHGNSFESCEYNVTIFDNSDSRDKIIQNDNQNIKISYGSLTDSDSNSLINYDNMKILQDNSWELQMLLSKVKEKRKIIFHDYAKNCLLDAIFCCTKAIEGIGSDVFASCWQKSALIYLANSILSFNEQRLAPAHCLEQLRNLEKNSITDKISIINDCLGIERATPSLLDRMCKSTIGFSDQIENNRHSDIILKKYQHLTKNSMLADCYVYLTCINHANFVSIKNSIHRNPDLIHILKVAFDLENDLEKIRHDLEIIHNACNVILATLSSK